MSKNEKSEKNGKVEMYDTVNIGRRTFMQGAVASAGLAAGSYYAVGNARAVAPLVPIGAAIGGAALGYLASEAVDYLLGDTRDYSGYTGADALHSAIMEGTLAMLESDEITMTSIMNNANYFDNIALPKGKAAAVEVMNAGGTQTEAQDAMLAEVDHATTVVATNLFEHLQSQLNQWYHFYQEVEANANLAVDSALAFIGAGTASVSQVTVNIDLFDGTTYPMDIPLSDDGTTQYLLGPNNWFSQVTYSGTATLYSFKHPLTTSADLSVYGTDSNGAIGVEDPNVTNDFNYVYTEISQAYADGYSNIKNTTTYYFSAYDTLVDARDRVVNNLSTFIADLYAAYEPGDIPLDDVVDPFTAYTEMSTNYNETGHYGYAAASAATLGIPSTHGKEMKVYLEESQVEVLGVVYASEIPYTTAQDPATDTQPTSFDVGETYDPSTITSPVFLAYEGNFDDGTQTDFVEVNQAFTISSMQTYEGKTINSTTLESRNLQTADVASLREELEQLRQLQLELQEQAQEETSSGSGGSLIAEDSGFLTERFAGIPGWAWLTAGVSGIYAFAQKDN